MAKPGFNLTLWLKSQLIRTPLEPVVNGARNVLTLATRWRHPELRELHREHFTVIEALKRLLRSDANCVDVGCHLGSMLKLFLKLAPRGRHHAFEPSPMKAAWLARRFPEVSVHAVALTDTEGEVTFYEQPSRSGFSGLAKGSEDAIEVRVPAMQLGSAIPDANVDLVKIDVEGAELLVLRGALQVLERSQPVIVFESTPTASSRFGYGPADLHAFYRDQGYHVYHFADWLAGKGELDLESFLACHRYPFRAMNYLALPGHNRS